jgi:hypothetical protein
VSVDFPYVQLPVINAAEASILELWWLNTWYLN